MKVRSVLILRKNEVFNLKILPCALALMLSGSICFADGEQQQQVATADSSRDQNLKAAHLAFSKQPLNLNTMSPGVLVDSVSPYQVMAGTVVPGTLVTGLNSDLPGTVIGQVNQNVYDTIEGKYLLIPQGTKLIGIYDSNTAFAQSRGAVIWQRMILPNGESMVLPNFHGSDKEGYVGFKDKVRSHYARVIWTSLIGAAITGGVASATDSDSNNNSFKSEAGSEAANNISNSVNSIVNKNLNIAPTIIIRPGYKFNIIIDQDLVLKPYKS